MPLYCFRCPECGFPVETTIRDPAPTCSHYAWVGELVPFPGKTEMQRDYKAENVGISANALESRKADWHDILPTVDEFKKPGDPDGLKGFAKWRSENQPKTPGARHPQEHLLRRSVAV